MPGCWEPEGGGAPRASFYCRMMQVRGRSSAAVGRGGCCAAVVLNSNKAAADLAMACPRSDTATALLHCCARMPLSCSLPLGHASTCCTLALLRCAGPHQPGSLHLLGAAARGAGAICQGEACAAGLCVNLPHCHFTPGCRHCPSASLGAPSPAACPPLAHCPAPSSNLQDPFRLPEYLAASVFLADINNEVPARRNKR